jgi:FixJ family two-component response regulator
LHDRLNSARHGSVGYTFVTRTKPKIAIVDDDASVCRALKRLIRSLDMDAETFASGEAFLELAAAVPSFHADCLIVDVQMPGMSGLELQSRLADTKVPIVFITAHDEVGAREQAFAAGAVAFLRKPFDDVLLAKTLETALSSGYLAMEDNP